MTRSLQTMVANAIVSTMIIPVAAERPPMKTISASMGCCSFIGTASTKVSASTPPPGEQQQPGKCDGQHEYVDEQEVQREQPHRLPEVALVDVLHHQYLELTRQYDDGPHGEQRQRDPTGVSRDAVDGEESAQRARGFCLRENLEPAI